MLLPSVMNEDSKISPHRKSPKLKKTLARHNGFDAIVKVIPMVIGLVTIILGFIQY
jgi:hypothetical protein